MEGRGERDHFKAGNQEFFIKERIIWVDFHGITEA